MNFGQRFGRRNDNPDKAGHYSSVHFNINSGHKEDSFDEQVFYKELTSILEINGWEIRPPQFVGSGPVALKDANELHLGEELFWGEIENGERENLVKMLSTANTFQLGEVEVKQEIYDVNDDQMIEILDSKRDEIKADLLAAFTTKRCDHYKHEPEYIIMDLSKQHDIYRLKRRKTMTGGINPGGGWAYNGVCQNYIKELFQELVDSGEIISAETKNGISYRTAKSDELKS